MFVGAFVFLGTYRLLTNFDLQLLRDKHRRDIRHGYVINYVKFHVLENIFFLFRHIIMIEHVTGFLDVRTMAVILMILTVYVIDQCV